MAYIYGRSSPAIRDDGAALRHAVEKHLGLADTATTRSSKVLTKAAVAAGVPEEHVEQLRRWAAGSGPASEQARAELVKFDRAAGDAVRRHAGELAGHAARLVNSTDPEAREWAYDYLGRYCGRWIA